MTPPAEKARLALRIAQSCRSRDLRRKHAAAARSLLEEARETGADVADVETELRTLEADLRQGVLPW